MERMAEILRALFRRALREHGRDAAALTDVIILRAGDRFGPRLGAQFSNGYRAWTALHPSELRAYCEQNAITDIATLRRRLLHEGQEMYARMLETHVAEIAFREHWAQVTGRMLRGREEPPLGTLHRLARLMGFGRRHTMLDIDESKAAKRGARLLEENLSSAQRQQYTKYRYFDVIGGKTGKRYRIHHGTSMNIDQLDKNGRRVCGWCFFPRGGLVAGDVMLAQKFAIELFEAEALQIANRLYRY
jgi:hypothetical protein